ncbi:unnamed protein product [Jaminaea pallidilutea]
MDEDALRAMLPMGFGKQTKGGRKGPMGGAAAADATTETSLSAGSNGTAPARPIQGPSLGPMTASRRAKEERKSNSDDDEDDDGLTAEEREANRRAEAEAGSDDEDDDDDDDQGRSDASSVDLGPESLSTADLQTAGLPVESHVDLKEHTKSVSALDVDPSGARVATGSYDYDVRLWDFGGMTSSFKPTKTFEPFRNYFIHDLAWSSNGERLLAVSGTSQPKLFDRNGNELATYKKGDVYLRDMKQTSGHVAEITSCSWLDDNTFVTASADSTIRLWDPEVKLKQRTVINVRSRERGGRTKVTAHAVSPDGAKTIAAACQDGALHLWSTSGNYARPNATVEGAHKKDTTTTSIAFSRDGRTLATRGGDGDDSVKLWDVRSFKKPLAERHGLANLHAQTSVIFSIDEQTLLTGTSGSNGARGGIEVLSRSDLSSVRTIDVPTAGPSSDDSVIRLLWHPRINQLFATTSTGSCCVFFSPTTSIRGALLALPKAAKQSRALSPSAFGSSEAPITTPGAGDLQSRGQGLSQAAKKRRMVKEGASDPRAPQKPMSGPGKGGRIGLAATHHMVQDIYGDKSDSRHEDPREALLRYADKDGEEGQGGREKKFTKAWEVNQPKTIYHQDKEGEQ